MNTSAQRTQSVHACDACDVCDACVEDRRKGHSA